MLRTQVAEYPRNFLGIPFTPNIEHPLSKRSETFKNAESGAVQE